MLLRSSIVVTRQQIIGIKYSLALAFFCCTSAYTAEVEDLLLAETGLELDQTAAKLTRHHKSVAGVTRATNHGIGEFVEDSNADFRKLNPLDGGNVEKESVNRKLADACPGSNPTACGCGEVSQTDYRGFIHTTENGHTCSAWTQGANYPDQGLDENYCRNPNEVGARAWCFVENPNILWDYCDVPTCSSTEQLSDPACVNTETYYSIDADIATIKSSIDDDVTRSHFLGGIVRLVAHDFMDYDFDEAPHLGQDGCLDWTSPSNTGLESIWCDDCALTKLYNAKYSRISRADFWVIAANSVIRQTSVNQELDLKKTFYWGRQDLDSCPGSALRLPTTQGCQDVEGVFLERMGLTWQDAVALLGAHTLGRGNKNFSGHHGTWVPNDKEAQIFDKKYYEELFRRAWFPRDEGTLHQDWTTGNPNSASPKMMLNTDMCLLYDIDSKFPCCSRTNLFDNQGNNRCITEELSNNECSSYDSSNERFPASQAVRKFLGGAGPNNNNAPFYDAFTIAWFKATTNGLDSLKPIRDKC